MKLQIIYKKLRTIFSILLALFFPERVRFKGQYEDWREKRIKCIVSYYGKNYFRNKKILELGCGYGDIGAVFARLGADVTCTDAKKEHLKVLRKRFSDLKAVRADLDEDKWPFEKDFDLILHLGTLYHLKNYEKNLRHCCKYSKKIILETEVCDSDDPYKIIWVKERHGYDQAFNKVGCRPSPACIERILKECGMRFKQLRSRECNSKDHIYNWNIKNTGKWRHGLRRIWFIEKQQ